MDALGNRLEQEQKLFDFVSLPKEILTLIFDRSVVDLLSLTKYMLVSRRWYKFTKENCKFFNICSFFENKIFLNTRQKIALASFGCFKLALTNEDINLNLAHFSRFTHLTHLKIYRNLKKEYLVNKEKSNNSCLSYLLNLTHLNSLAIKPPIIPSELEFLKNGHLKKLKINFGHHALPNDFPSNLSTLTSLKILFDGSVHQTNRKGHLSDRSNEDSAKLQKLVYNLPKLYELKIDSNFTGDYTIDWARLTRLTKLNTKVILRDPEVITQLTSLKILKICQPLQDFSFTHFTALKKLESIKIFSVLDDYIAYPENQIFFPESLKSLSIEALSANYSFENLTNLKSFTCVGDILDKSISSLTNLEYLSVTGTKTLMDIFKTLKNSLFPRLVELSVDEFDFQFPLSHLACFQTLRILNLSERRPIEFPFFLTQLQELSLFSETVINMQVDEQFTNLTSLEMNAKEVSGLEKLSHLKNLRFLSIQAGNVDERLNEQLTQLVKLNLAKINSKIQTMKYSICK